MPLAPPAFQFYAGDFLVSTTTMSNAQVGAYIRLLSHQWVNGGIPADLKLISKIVHENVPRTRGLMIVLGSKFVLDHTGVLKNPRLEEVRQKQLAYYDLQATKAKKGGRPRANGKNPRVLETPNPNETSSSSSSSSVRTYKNAAAPRTPSPQAVEKSRRKDPVKTDVLAAMIRDDILPQSFESLSDLSEAAKCRAAQLGLAYSSRAIATALSSAQAQLAKQGRRYES